MFLDTQIVSYAMKGCWTEPIEGSQIVSIVANEFLLVQGSKLNQANYYIPHPSSIRHLTLTSETVNEGSRVSRKKPTHPFGKSWTDSIIMEFGQEHPPIVEYGNFAISETINGSHYPLFLAAINFLEKRQRKVLIDRFRFLLDCQIECVPVQRGDVETAFGLLRQFKERHNLKGSFRNSWNDVLILAASRNRGDELITKDNELSRFAANMYSSRLKEEDGFLRLAFAEGQNTERQESQGTKRYVNSGWLVRFRNLGNQAFQRHNA